jgi:hypothetical protein
MGPGFETKMRPLGVTLGLEVLVTQQQRYAADTDRHCWFAGTPSRCLSSSRPETKSGTSSNGCKAGERGRQMVERTFTWEVATEQMIRLYEGKLKEQRVTPADDHASQSERGSVGVK